LQGFGSPRGIWMARAKGRAQGRRACEDACNKGRPRRIRNRSLSDGGLAEAPLVAQALPTSSNCFCEPRTELGRLDSIFSRN
jgi:hypothetical protein